MVLRNNPAELRYPDYQDTNYSLYQPGLVLGGTGSGRVRLREEQLNLGIGEALVVELSFEDDTTVRTAEIVLDYGNWDDRADEDFYRWGVYLYTRPSYSMPTWFDSNIMDGEASSQGAIHIGDLDPVPDTHYCVLLGIETDGDYVTLIWPEDSSLLGLELVQRHGPWPNNGYDLLMQAEDGYITIHSYTIIDLNE
jgi:hypothetical protein